MTRRLLYISIIIISFASCKNRGNDSPNTPVSEAKKKLEIVNKALVDKDRERIKAYIERHKLDGMEENKSGLFYLIWGESSGPKVKDGDIVFISYKIT